MEKYLVGVKKIVSNGIKHYKIFGTLHGDKNYVRLKENMYHSFFLVSEQ